MCKTQLTTADLMTKHQHQRKEMPSHKQPNIQQQALKKTKHSSLDHGTPTFLQQSRAWNSNIFIEELEDLS